MHKDFIQKSDCANIEHGCCNDGCRVLDHCTINEVSNIPCFPQTAKVPVVLAEPTLQICVQSDIKLPHPAVEIKRVRKDAFISQCKLLPTGHRCIFKLFVNGHIRKNIEYATIDKCNPKALCGDIRHTTVHIPYSAATELQFPPCGPFPIFTRTEESFTEFLDACGRGPNLDKKLFSNGVFYNEQPFSELVCVNFQEYDIGGNCCQPPSCECPEKTFSIINEHIVMDLKVKVLQLQQVPLPATVSGCCKTNRCCNK
ncbi:MAG: hypothetical protein RLZ12_254 [Bacillota bacterium]|jgi:hypothetical protein